MRNIVMGFYGPETDEWIGKRIRIMQAPFTDDKGDTKMVVRIHPKLPVSAQAAKAQELLRAGLQRIGAGRRI